MAASTAETIQACFAHMMRVLGKGLREAVNHKALSTALNWKGLYHRSELSCSWVSAWGWAART